MREEKKGKITNKKHTSLFDEKKKKRIRIISIYTRKTGGKCVKWEEGNDRRAD